MKCCVCVCVHVSVRLCVCVNVCGRGQWGVPWHPQRELTPILYFPLRHGYKKNSWRKFTRGNKEPKLGKWTSRQVQPVPKKMRLKMVIGTKIGILKVKLRFLFNLTLEKKPVMTIQDSYLHSSVYFESLLFKGCIMPSTNKNHLKNISMGEKRTNSQGNKSVANNHALHKRCLFHKKSVEQRKLSSRNVDLSQNEFASMQISFRRISGDGPDIPNTCR